MKRSHPVAFAVISVLAATVCWAAEDSPRRGAVACKSGRERDPKVIAAMEKERAGDLKGAIADWEGILDAAPKSDAAALSHLAELWEREGDLAKAEEKLNVLQEKFPENAWATDLRGHFHLRHHAWDKAEKDLRHAIELNEKPGSNYETIILPLAIRLWAAQARNGKLDAATKELAARVKPLEGEKDPCFDLAMAQYLANVIPRDRLIELADAEGTFPKETRRAKAFYAIGMKCLAELDKEGAIDNFDKAVKAAPEARPRPAEIEEAEQELKLLRPPRGSSDK
ncbi:MAG: hypothetical protein K8T20_06935 [Planctomycetes bacterium]|nr:hypothetical protein [Planctomycetota bacterium]